MTRAEPRHLRSLPHRFSIVGTSGSGKSTLGRILAAHLGVPFIELDSIRHQANWVELPDPEFCSRVAALVECERWVIDGTYAVVRDLVWDRATTIVWLDLPRWQVMLQVIWRSVSRALMGTVLWNGNRERWSMLFIAEHPIRWAWRTYHGRKRQYEAALDARWVRLRSRAEMRRWLDAGAREDRGAGP